MLRVDQLTGFLSRLRRDVRGNVIAIVAASLIPLIGLIGGGVDLSRLYLTKVRLQQACDAGALAGRKAMGGGAWAPTVAQTSPLPNTVATMFFNANFKANAYGSTSTTPTFSENAGDVTGTASATVPMTLMQVFGSPTRTITVTCDTQMQLPNTDVMFVLDNTGSMLCAPSQSVGCPTSETSTSKIAGLKVAVKCFYEVLAQYATDVHSSCGTSVSGSGVSGGAQIRFGFVPYTTNVNVSALGLPSSYFATNWKYQSRSITWTAWASTTGSCSNVPTSTTSTQYQTTGSGSNCKVQKRTAYWTYGQISQDLSNWSGSNVTLPIGDNYTNSTVTWDGCTEESAPISDINALPSASDSTTQYAPALPDALYMRAATGSNLITTYNSLSTNQVTSTSNYYNDMRNDHYFCPTAAQKLQSWAVGDFDTYVNSLYAAGNTYHDIGMLWGGRIMSPEGMFKADTALTPSGGQIQHHVIFMTDGDAQAASCDYTNYGVSWFDQRTTTNVGSAYDCAVGTKNTVLTNLVNTRLVALCTSVKNEPNTTLWVISFGGTGIASDTKARLTACATDSSHYFDATSSASLQSAFQLIAAQISQLRLTH